MALYGRTLGFEFVWDDLLFFQLPVYARLDPSAAFGAPANGIEYLPLRDVSLQLDHALFGAWPGGFHATNVVLFAAAALAVTALYRIVLRAAPDVRVRESAATLALGCALVFVAHPLQAEPVAFVSQRNALLALLFLLASLLAWARHTRAPGPLPWAAALALALAACFSKATALGLPLLALVLHLHLVRDETFKTALRRTLPLFVVALAAAAVHLVVAQETRAVGTSDLFGPAEILRRLPKALVVPQFYLYEFLWPVNLSIENSLASLRESPALLIASTALLGGAFAALAVRGARQRALPGLLAWAYLAALLPVTNLLPTYPAVADRYAQMGLVWLVPLVWVPLAVRLPRAARLPLAVLVLAVLSTLCWRQVGTWRDEPTLFAHAVAVDPEATYSLGNLGAVLWDRGRQDEALAAFARLETLRPRDFRPDYFRGLHAREQGRTAEAQRWLESAASKSGLAVYTAHLELADLYQERGDLPRARRALEEAQRLVGRAHGAGDDEARIEEALRQLQALERQRRPEY